MLQRKENIIQEKTEAYASRIVRLYIYLRDVKHEQTLSKQILRSGTSIGANTAESRNAQSKADFINKLSIALKEANETEYWLMLLKETEYLSQNEYDSIITDCRELLKLLISIIKTTKGNEPT